MSDLIRRSALIEEFRKCHISFNGTPMEESDMMISYRSILRVINRQPPVESKPVVHAKWLPIGMRGVGLYRQLHYCSECKGHGFDYYDFCNNCGCDMRGGKND